MSATQDYTPSLLHRGASAVPFRCLILAHIDPSSDHDELKAPVPVDSDSLERTLARIEPTINIYVDNPLFNELLGSEGPIEATLSVKSINDFLPANILSNLPFLNALSKLLHELSFNLQKPSISFPLSFQSDEGLVQSRALSNLASREDIEFLFVALQKALNSVINSILHDPDWQRLETSWRGIDWLCHQAKEFTNCQLELAHYCRDSMFDDVAVGDALESNLFAQMYSNSYGQYGGVPYSALLVDDYFCSTGADIDLLKGLTTVAAASHFLVITGGSAKLFGVNHLRELSSVSPLGERLQGLRFTKWRSFIASSEASYAAMSLPRVRFRPSYGDQENEVSPGVGLDWFKELQGESRDNCLWGNSAFLFLSNLMRSFTNNGLCTAISDDNGGVIRVAQNGAELPLEYSLSEAQEIELMGVGLNPLCMRQTDSELVYRTSNSLRWGSIELGKYRESLDSIASSRLEYLMIAVRVIHCLRILFRESLGTSDSPEALTTALDGWLKGFVLDMESPSDELRNSRPLRRAKVSVVHEPQRNWFEVQVELTPHLKYLGQDVGLNANVSLQTG